MSFQYLQLSVTELLTLTLLSTFI